MTRARNKYLELLSRLEDTYKVTFRTLDHTLHNINSDSDKSQVIDLRYAGPKGSAWSGPISFQRVSDIYQTIYFQCMVNVFVSTAWLTKSYLRSMCYVALLTPPADDSWFSWSALGMLSNISDDIPSLTCYKKVDQLFQFVADAESGDPKTPGPTVTHGDILTMFDNCRLFAADFESAFMLANGHVKEGTI